MTTDRTVAATKAGISSQPLARALLILDVLASSPRGASLDEIAERAAIPRSTTHRMIRSLLDEGMVVSKRDEARFYLGPRCMRYAGQARAHLLADWATALARLAQAANEVVDVSVLSNGEVNIIHQIEAPHRLRAVAHAGDRLPCHATASGKALLALLPAGQVTLTLSAKLQKLTPSTITDRAALQTCLAQIREAEGVAFEYEENTIGVSGVAVGFWSALGIPVAVGIPVPNARFTGREQELAELLRSCRREIIAGRWQ